MNSVVGFSNAIEQRWDLLMIPRSLWFQLTDFLEVTIHE
jgi:hypothetical protein